MSCYHPLKAFQIGIHESGKPKYKICSYNTEYLYFSKIDNKWNPINTPFKREPWFTDDYVDFHFITEFKEIPCGKCVGCRLKYSRDWATRCMLEAKYHKNNYFLTLTYNDENLPCGEYTDLETGEIKTSHSLSKRDFQLFMKRLRKQYCDDSDSRIRYFASGEYGDTTARPHYHAIVFGLNLDDLKFYKQSKHGFSYYTSDFLNKIWSKGFVIISEVSWDTCAYVARYVMKKQNGEYKKVYDDFNIIPEFSLMSRRPGIGREYLEENMLKIYSTDELIYSTPQGGKKSKPPRYFDKIFEEEFPDLFANLKENRENIAKSLRDNKLRYTSLSYPELLEVEERIKLDKISSLKRTCI